MLENMKDRWPKLLIQLIGWGFLLAGACAALIGPVELYTFYLFTPGGRFHYAGFGFGALMFGNIAIQTASYYLIALICIPLGYGHLKSHDWARKITLALIWDWLILGLPLSMIIVLMLVTSKGVSPAGLPFVLVILILMYPILPLVAAWLYRSDTVRDTFHRPSPLATWTNKTPVAVLVLGSLMILMTLALHVPILFNGLFPLFGSFQYGLDGVYLLDLSIVLLIGLTWGVLRQRRWAWWGTSFYLGTMTTSAIISFLSVDPHHIITKMKFAALEMDALSGVPVQGGHLALLIALPALLTLLLLLRSRHYFGQQTPKVEIKSPASPIG